MSGSAQTVGSVVALWRYPVKSMMGEELNASEVAEVGLLGDRAYALVDSTDGKVASAKNPRKWPTLFDCRAALADAPKPGKTVPPVRIVLPDGTIVSGEQLAIRSSQRCSSVRSHLRQPSASIGRGLNPQWAPMGGRQRQRSTGLSVTRNHRQICPPDIHRFRRNARHRPCGFARPDRHRAGGGRIEDAEGRLHAHGTSTCLVVSRKP
jgi:MOSC N-terminal beta barrel domain